MNVIIRYRDLLPRDILNSLYGPAEVLGVQPWGARVALTTRAHDGAVRVDFPRSDLPADMRKIGPRA